MNVAERTLLHLQVAKKCKVLATLSLEEVDYLLSLCENKTKEEKL